MSLEVKIEKTLHDFTLDVDFSCVDEPLAVLGASGAGKSMMLRCIAGLECPNSGKITLQNRALFDSEKGVDLPSRERRVGMLFQSYSLFPHLSVRENVGFGLAGLAPSDREERIALQIEQLHLDGLENRLPCELSGGEQQRAALARALAIAPDALLLDEPLSALDTHLRSQIEKQLVLTLAEFRRPALFVTHNIEEAYRIAPNLLVLSKGRVAAHGPREEIFRQPPSLEVALLTGLKNYSSCEVITENRVKTLDWNCELQVRDFGSRAPAYVGIRAHHVEFLTSAGEDSHCSANVFPCWLVRKSETPFHVTAFLSLRESGSQPPDAVLQAEITKEKWLEIETTPQPWRIRVCPERILLLNE